MNSAVYDRLKSLVTGVGIAVDDNDCNDAELFSYCQAIDFVRQAMENIVAKVFVTSIDNLDNYINLLNLDPQGKTYEQLYDEIKNRLSLQFGYATKGTATQAFASVGSGTYSIKTATVIFKDVLPQDLVKLSKFVQGYVTPFTTCLYGGSSPMTFDDWDEWAQSFAQYDAMGLPFDFLDSYNKESETNE